MDVFDLSAKITLDTSEYENGLDVASVKTNGFSGVASSVFKGIAGAVAIASSAVSAFALVSVNVGKDFDSAMSQVVATMGYSVAELNDSTSEASANYELLKQKAMELGSTTQYTATQSAEALNFMALAGYTVNDSMTMLPTVLNLASAGSMDLATASDMVTDAQTALGLSLEKVITNADGTTTKINEVEIMVDQMAKTASSSNTSVEQLGEAFLTIGGLAQYMSGGTEELSTVLGLLADNGIKGSEAGTHLRNMILKLAEPTDDGAKMMKELGLSVYDTEGNMRSFQDIFTDLNKSMADFTDEQKIDAFAALFNTRDIAGATALLNTTSERWDELGEKILEAEGSAEKMAEVQLDNLEGDVTKFKSALEGAQLVISEQLTPDLRDFTKFGTKSISELSDAFKEGGLSGVMSKFGEVLSEGLKMILQETPKFIDAGIKLLEALGQGLLDNAPLLIDTGFQLFDMLMESIGNADSSGIGEKCLVIIEKIANGIVERLPVLINVGFTILESLVNGIVSSIPELLPRALEFIQDFANKCAEKAPELIQRGFELLQNMIEGIVMAIPILIERVPEIITTFANIINDNFPTILKMGFQLIVQLVLGIVQAIPVIFENMPKIIEAIISVIEAIQWLDLGKNIIELFGKGIKSMVTFAGNAIKTVNDKIIDLIKAVPKKLFELGKKFIKEGLIEGIKNMASNMLRYVEAFMFDVLFKFSDFSLVEVGKNLIRGLWEGISNMTKWIYDKIAGFGAGIVNAVKDVFGVSSPSKVFKEIGNFCVEGFGEGLEDISDMTEIQNDINKSIGNMRIDQIDFGKIESKDIKINTNYAESYQDAIDGAIDRVLETLDRYLPNIGKYRMVLDTGTLVGEIAPSMDYALGDLIKFKAR